MKKKITWRFKNTLPRVAIILLLATAILTPMEFPETAQAQNDGPIRHAADFCSGIAKISPDECDALAALHQKTGGERWIDNTGWMKRSNPCDWRGVTCSEQRVIKLILYNNKLTGSIPPELGKLIHLEELDLSENRLSGAMPPELGLLANLKYLSLSKNRLSGTIPVEFGNLTRLESLDIPGNQLTGSLPPEIGALTRLRRLDLSINRLSGKLPPETGLLINLETLYLRANQFSGTIPDSIRKLHQLKLIKIDYNGLETADSETKKFLTSRQPDWENGQTRTPTHLTASWEDGKLKLAWTPIDYTDDGGEYIIHYAASPEGPWRVHGKTSDKKAAEYIAENIQGNSPTRYYYSAQSHTPPHRLKGAWGKQQNDVFSQPSPSVALPGTYYVDVKATPPGKGWVTGGGNYPEGADTILEAIPETDFAFVRWNGDAFGIKNPLKITVDETKEIIAEFKKIMRDISTQATPENGGTITGGGEYQHGGQATLKAIPNRGYSFVKWEGDASGRSNPLKINVDNPKKITARFARSMRRLSTRAAPANGGTVMGTGRYKNGNHASIEAIPNRGYYFIKWEGDASGRSNPLKVKMNRSKKITARFARSMRRLSTRAAPANGGMVMGGGGYKHGNHASIEAIPNRGYYFIKWEGDASGISNPLKIKMNRSKNITAVFGR